MGRAGRPKGNTGGFPHQSLYWRAEDKEPIDIPFNTMRYGEEGTYVEEEIESRFRSARIVIEGEEDTDQKLLTSQSDQNWKATIDMPFASPDSLGRDFMRMDDMVSVSVEGGSKEEVVDKVRRLEQAIVDNPKGFPSSEGVRVLGYSEAATAEENKETTEKIMQSIEGAGLDNSQIYAAFERKLAADDFQDSSSEIFLDVEGEVPGVGRVWMSVVSHSSESAIRQIERLFPAAAQLDLPTTSSP